jgi:predicted RNase H-like HicB family nuclease
MTPIWRSDVWHTYSASVWQEGDWYVAQCLEVDVASQGETETEALRNLAEALRLHFKTPRADRTPALHRVQVTLDAA